MADNNNHTFNAEFATRYGIEEALIFGDIYFWCLKNKENNINLKKGSDNVERYYTFNSTAALQSTYKYMNITKVYRVIEKLEAEGLIITGCFNKRVGDRTRWYAVTEKGEEVFLECNKTPTSTLYNEAQFSNCKMHNSQNEMHNSHFEINNLQNEMTLPDTNTVTNSDTNKYTAKCGKTKKQAVSKSKQKQIECEEYLNTLSEADKKNSELLTQYMLQSFQKTDPNYNRQTFQLLEWQVEFAKFLINSHRSYDEVKTSLEYAFTSYWSQYIFKPLNFINNYEKIFRQSVMNKNNFGRQRSVQPQHVDLSDRIDISYLVKRG